MEPGLTQFQVSLRDFFVLSFPTMTRAVLFLLDLPASSLTTGLLVIVQPVSSMSLPTDPQENQCEVVNLLDRTADKAAINTSEVVLEVLLETFLTKGYSASWC